MNIVADLTPFRCEKPPEEAALVTLELIKALKTTSHVRLMLLTAAWNDAELRRRIGADRCVFVNVYGALHKRNPAGGLEVPQDRRRWRRLWLEISYGKPELLFCPFGVIVYQPSAIPTVCTVQDTRHLVYPQFFDSPELAYRNQLFDDVCRRPLFALRRLRKRCLRRSIHIRRNRFSSRISPFGHARMRLGRTGRGNFSRRRDCPANSLRFIRQVFCRTRIIGCY